MNNHQPLTMNHQPPKTGFTLVEMLVVIAILGILMAMMVPAAGLIMKRAKISSTKGDAGVVATVLLKYQAEYNRWPSTYAPNTKDTTDKEWVNMMGPKPGSGPVPTNPKRIIFFEPGGGALSTNGVHAGAFVDPWGNPFKFRLDLEGAGEILSPDPNAVKPIRARAIAWSAGSDGDYTTFPDNEKVESWDR
jgi:prepilin-type N-terminal cleavage/methylation domain-containing protein